MNSEEAITINFDIDFTYKSVLVSKENDSVFDFINGLPTDFKNHIYGLLTKHKDNITFIPLKINENLYASIYKQLVNNEAKLTLYVFEKKEDMLDLLERQPLNMKDLEGDSNNVIDDIKKGIQSL